MHSNTAKTIYSKPENWQTINWIHSRICFFLHLINMKCYWKQFIVLQFDMGQLEQGKICSIEPQFCDFWTSQHGRNRILIFQNLQDYDKRMLNLQNRLKCCWSFKIVQQDVNLAEHWKTKLILQDLAGRC